MVEVDVRMNDTSIKMYGAPWCPDCRRSKALLDRRGVAYDWIDIDENPEGARYIEQVNEGKRIIPTIVFPDGSILVEPSDAELARKVAS